MARKIQLLGDLGKPLPEVTPEDNGKILKVQNEEWTVVEEDETEYLSNLEIEELLKNYK